MNTYQPAPAPLGARVAAWVLDQLLGTLLYVGSLAVVMTTAEDGDPSLRALLLVPALVLVYAVLLVWLIATRGWTPGKRALGLRVVRVEDGRRLGWGRALGRMLMLGLIAGSTFGVGAVVLLLLARQDPQGRAAHDKSAKAIVVRAREAGPAPSIAANGEPRQSLPPPSPIGVSGSWDHPTVMPRRAAPSTGELISVVPGGARDLPRLGAEVLDDELTAEPTVEAADDEDVELTRMSRPRATPVGWQLEVAPGQVVRVGGTGLLGRDPQPRPGEAVEHLVPIDDQSRSISKTHLEFGVDGDALWICDRGSTNGSRVETADGEGHQCPPGERVQVTSGSSLWVGDHRVRVRRG